MSTLSLNTVELVSTLRPVAYKGAPSSEDYNDSQEEFLLDLTSIVTFVNNVLIPIMKALPENAISGLEGRSLYGDLTDQTSLFYNSVTGEPLTVADSLRQLFSVLSSLKNAVNSNSIQVGQLQQKLSSTNQNDFAIAIQNLTNGQNVANANQLSSDAAITELQASQNNIKNVRIAVSALASSTTAETITWAAPFADNNYTVNVSLNTSSTLILVRGFTYLPGGTGIVVNLSSEETTDTNVTLNLFAQHD